MSALPGADKTLVRKRRWQKARSPGRARRNPLKPLRAGMPGDSGVLVVTRVRSITTKCTRGRGCSGHPAFPTPSLGREINAQLGRIARRDREAVSGIVLLLESFEVGVHEALFDPMQHNAPVMPGLDPGIHQS